MLKKIWVLIALTASTSGALWAQNPTNFNFPVDKYDFGVVDEGNKAAHTFEFTNTGKDTILLKSENVRASCGCTTPSFSTEAILPGQKGNVTAEFNSQGRPGMFHKTVTIYYKDQVAKTLTIKGIVEPVTPAVTYTDAQLKKSPKLVLEKTNINFGKIEKGQKGLYSVKVSNLGKDTLFITKSQTACSCITHKLLKEKSTEEIAYVLPGKSATLQLTYNPTADGLNRDILALYTNDLAAKRVSLTLESDVVDAIKPNSIIQEDKTSTPFGK